MPVGCGVIICQIVQFILTILRSCVAGRVQRGLWRVRPTSSPLVCGFFQWAERRDNPYGYQQLHAATGPSGASEGCCRECSRHDECQHVRQHRLIFEHGMIFLTALRVGHVTMYLRLRGGPLPTWIAVEAEHSELKINFLTSITTKRKRCVALCARR